uniref:Uncharacterized protein n=1 Tax=Sinocyclocheilus grahami TaxID=75366 RepID=A0A672NQL6_SINGR
MVREFRDIQKKAVILRSCSSTDSKLGHYDLRLNAYTWASSPIRRYLDLILLRLLHTMLSKEILKQADYTQVEINRFCLSGMDQTHYKEPTMELKLAAVVQVQLGTELQDGFPVPVVQLLSVNQCFEICLEHTRNPIDCFSKTVCNASKPVYESYKEYQNIWSQLCQIDTAYNALEENDSVILEGVHITWSGDETNLQGFFYLTKTQKKQWCLEFDVGNCFLCIRLRDQKPENSENDAEHLDSSEILDLQGSLPFTWVAHAVTTKPKKQKNEDNQDKITFQVTKRSISYIPPNVSEQETNFTIEVIPKKIPYLLREHVIENLKRANNLVKNVATRQNLKEVNASKWDNMTDRQNHISQNKAVEEAVKKPFTVIQGPPGTGKTVVGIHIAYQFFMKNQDLLASSKFSKSSKSTLDEKPPKKPAILYCGPSNKSVDIVAEQLLKLKGVLKPLRIYCDQMEMCVYPYTGSDLKLCRKSLRDEKPKEELK